MFNNSWINCTHLLNERDNRYNLKRKVYYPYCDYRHIFYAGV